MGVLQQGCGEEVEDEVVAVQEAGGLLRVGCAGGVAGGCVFRKQGVETAVGTAGSQSCGVLYQAAFGPVPAEFGEFDEVEGFWFGVDDDVSGVVVGGSEQGGGTAEGFEEV